MSVAARVAPAARSSIKWAAAGLDLLRRPEPGVTILIYHRVGAGSGGQMDLSPAMFDEQLAWLTANRRVISLDDAIRELSGNESPDAETRQRPAVVLTFDDGTTDWVDHVLPALGKHRVPATFYVATSFVEDQTPFPGDGRPISWSGLSEMASSDLVTIGSHTHRHLLMDRLGSQEIADELDRSIDMLRTHIGVTADHFAYPKAVLGSPEAQKAIEQRFRSAVVAGTRPNPAGTDLFRLHRSPIQACDSTRWFRRKAAGGLRGEDDLRQLANRARYRKLDS